MLLPWFCWFFSKKTVFFFCIFLVFLADFDKPTQSDVSYAGNLRYSRPFRIKTTKRQTGMQLWGVSHSEHLVWNSWRIIWKKSAQKNVPPAKSASENAPYAEVVRALRGHCPRHHDVARLMIHLGKQEEVPEIRIATLIQYVDRALLASKEPERPDYPLEFTFRVSASSNGHILRRRVRYVEY